MWGGTNSQAYVAVTVIKHVVIQSPTAETIPARAEQIEQEVMLRVGNIVQYVFMFCRSRTQVRNGARYNMLLLICFLILTDLSPTWGQWKDVNM